MLQHRRPCTTILGYVLLNIANYVHYFASTPRTISQLYMDTSMRGTGTYYVMAGEEHHLDTNILDINDVNSESNAI